MARLLHCSLVVILASPWAATAAEEYVHDAAAIVAAADWSRMEVLEVELGEHEYRPETLRLKSGQPYKLILTNHGEEKHYFVAPEFYRSIATRKVQADGAGEIKAPYLTALEMMAEGGRLDLYFVAVKPGEYPVYCTIDDHRDEGMEGRIVVD